jgi:hypothetical protein
MMHKKNLKVRWARLYFSMAPAEAVAFDKAVKALNITASVGARQAIHLWLLHLLREIEEVDAEEAKKRAENPPRRHRKKPEV